MPLNSVLPLKTATPLLRHGAQRQESASARYSDRALFMFLFRVEAWMKSLEVTSSYSGRVWRETNASCSGKTKLTGSKESNWHGRCLHLLLSVAQLVIDHGAALCLC